MVLIAQGTCPTNASAEGDGQATLTALQSSATSAVSLLTLIANRMQMQGSGVIAVIGSVAGGRGPKSTYVYGSSKALVAVFAQGLADRLDVFGVRVITVKPGWVDTPMTASLAKGPLWVGPESVARQMHARIAAVRSVSYCVPRFWWAIMAVVRCLPDYLRSQTSS